MGKKFTPEEWKNLLDKTRHDYVRDKALERLKEEGFINIQESKELGKNRERRIDIYAEKDGKKFGIEVWTQRELYEKIRDYEKVLDEIILVIPAKKKNRLWCVDTPDKYLR